MMSEEQEIFLEESYELLEEIEATLLELKDSPDDKEKLNHLFRNFHTIKGSGAMFGFNHVADFTHKIENVIDSIRKGEFDFNPALIDPLLTARDTILRLIEADDDADQISDNQTEDLFKEIDAIIGGGKNEKPVPEKIPTDLKILIVEDDFTSRFILQNFLSAYGTPHIAIDGYEAVSAMKMALTENKNYDLVCLDIMMPGIDGKKVSEEIRRLESEKNIQNKSKIVMTSAISDKETINQLLSNNYCDLYLVKPVSIKKLAEFIHQSL